ncbi:MAG: hypothetical protein HRT71_02625 [Flavobacteriales bacterium]|nr:hypothetical protein [Flavobacteriales bacterium]
MKNKIYAIVIGFALVGCSQEELQPKAYVKWVENPENGLHMEVEKSGVKLKLQYQTPAYTVLNELRQNQVETKVLLDRTKAKMGMEYFTLKMSTDQNQPFFAERIKSNGALANYVNNTMKNDLYVVDKDTLRCKLFHYENMNGLAPYDTFVLGFESSTNKGSDLEFLYDAREIDLGWIKIKIDRKDIDNIPRVATI